MHTVLLHCVSPAGTKNVSIDLCRYSDGKVQLSQFRADSHPGSYFSHHKAEVRSVSFDPTGDWLLTGKLCPKQIQHETHHYEDDRYLRC